MVRNGFSARDRLTVDDRTCEIFRLDRLDGAARLPYSLKVLLENLLRHEDGTRVTAEQIGVLSAWDATAGSSTEIQFTPARVLLQDFTGAPCVVDLVAMRDAMSDLGGNPSRINPFIPAELVIDHSVIADVFGRSDAFRRNADLEFGRNQERYQLLRWAQQSFDDFRVVPLATRATIGNMSPEYGSTCAIFPIDAETLAYLRLTGRPERHVRLVEAYAKEQGLWHDPAQEPDYSQRVELDLATVEPSIAGPKRPQDRIALGAVQPTFRRLLAGERQSVFDAATEYARDGVPLIVLAGADYGSGSSRDWAAKGTLLLGVKAVLATSFERIHCANLIGMGVLPLQFMPGQSPQSLGLTGEETYTITGLAGADPLPRSVTVRVEADHRSSPSRTTEFAATVRIDTPAEAAYYRHGGILPYVLRRLLHTDETWKVM